MATIYPSLISADLLNLEKTIKNLDPYCAGYHLDIMDHHFAPNLTWGPDFVNAITKITTRQLWVHLMIENPLELIERLHCKHETLVSIHIENKMDISKTINAIRGKNWRPSIAINPKTPPEKIFPLASSIDQVLIMSVNPGFSGQQFIKETADKINPLVIYRQQHNLSFTIGIDGGITTENIVALKDQGVDQFAVASAIFNSENPVMELQNLSELVG